MWALPPPVHVFRMLFVETGILYLLPPRHEDDPSADPNQTAGVIAADQALVWPGLQLALVHLKQLSLALSWGLFFWH